MNYNKADFIASYGISSQLPESDRPELSFSGRSNVGKSSLINKLCSRKNLARVSSTPGKTATINFYSVDDCYFVDLPGWSFLLGGVLLYALRGHRRVQLTAWAVLIFLCDFVPTFGMLCRQADFVWTQMFTDYYEWFGVAAVLLMLLYNGQRGSGHKRLFYWFYPAHVYLLYGASCLVYNVLR